MVQKSFDFDQNMTEGEMLRFLFGGKKNKEQMIKALRKVIESGDLDKAIFCEQLVNYINEGKGEAVAEMNFGHYMGNVREIAAKRMHAKLSARMDVDHLYEKAPNLIKDESSDAFALLLHLRSGIINNFRNGHCENIISDYRVLINVEEELQRRGLSLGEPRSGTKGKRNNYEPGDFLKNAFVKHFADNYHEFRGRSLENRKTKFVPRDGKRKLIKNVVDKTTNNI